MRALEEIQAEIATVRQEAERTEEALRSLRERSRALAVEREEALAAVITPDSPDAQVLDWHGRSPLAHAELERRAKLLHPAVFGVTHWTHAEEKPTRVRVGLHLALHRGADEAYVVSLEGALVEFAHRFCPDTPAVPVTDPEAGLIYADLLHRDLTDAGEDPDGEDDTVVRDWKVLFEPRVGGRAVFQDARSPEEGRFAGSVREVLAHATRRAWYRERVQG